MKRLVLLRYSQDEMGTQGLIYGKEGSDHSMGAICYTLELPWKQNKPNVSCIPDGNYTCRSDSSGKHKWFTVTGVTGRAGIEIHTGNSVKDSKGCILVGKSCDIIDDNWILHHSEQSAILLKKIVGDAPFQLNIITLI